MLLKLFTLLQKPEVAAFLKFLLAAFGGGFIASEMHEPKVTAGWSIPFFGQRVERPNPVEAIGRISMGNTGCTGTIIGPISRSADTIAILTAAHCIKVGQAGTMKLKDGRQFPFRCATRDATADAAWLIAKRPEGKIPFALLASAPPPPDSAVWHMGYGVDKPGNLETGTFIRSEMQRGQFRYRLNVSPGDSGGGIIATAAGEVLSPVCCTSRLAGVGDVWGSSPERAAAIKPPANTFSVSDEPPLLELRLNPTIPLPHPDWPAAPVED